MRKSFFALLSVLVITSMLLVACGGGAAPAPAAPADQAATEATAEATEATTDEAAAEATEAPAEDAAAAATPTEPAPIVSTPDPALAGRTQVRWYVGLGTGTDPAQVAVQQEVVQRFNESQDEIELLLEIVPYNSARDTLSTQIASGSGPDIIGPVGGSGANAFYGQWLDLTPLLESSAYDLSQFGESSVNFFMTEEGQIGLPFATFPSGLFYQREMFDEAGLNYPPAAYGEKYVMPDGTEVDWTWETMTEVAKMLTVDVNGNDATMAEFDPTQIVQYGYVPQYQDPRAIGSFWQPGRLVADDGATAQIPEVWAEAWKWYYDGMWGDAPFVPTGPVIQSPEFGAGNPFNGGKIAMAATHLWYTCCIGDAGESWDIGTLPSYNGTVTANLNADTFRIWKGTKNPEAAFKVLTYLIGDASLDLLSVYGGMPARIADQEAFFENLDERYPQGVNWEAIRAGTELADIPSNEAWTPGYSEMYDRVNTFNTLLQSEGTLDVDAEIAKLQADLQTIYDKALAAQ
jgi:multiple sugar transport system substrate-binding protein